MENNGELKNNKIRGKGSKQINRSIKAFSQQQNKNL